MLMRIWAFLTGQRLVWLLDHDGELTLTVARETPFGLVAKRYWPFNTKNVRCIEGGKVENGSYVREWRDA